VKYLDAGEIRAAWQNGESEFLLQSSGSTGSPTLITLPRALLVWSARTTGKALQISEKDSICCCLPLDKTGGFMQLIRSMVWDIPIAVFPPSGNPISQLESEHNFTCISLTPAQLAMALQSESDIRKLKRFRVVLIGGDMFPEPVEICANEAGIAWIHTYGMTETASHIALRKPGETLFTPLPGVIAYVNSETAALSFRIHYMEGKLEVDTRDCGEVYSDGTFKPLGRLDHVIISGGVKIHPEPIEQMLKKEACFQGSDLVLAGIADEQYGKRVVLFVEGTTPAADAEEILKRIQADYPLLYLKEIRFMPAFPRTPTGKVIRYRLA